MDYYPEYLSSRVAINKWIRDVRDSGDSSSQSSLSISHFALERKTSWREVKFRFDLP